MLRNTDFLNPVSKINEEAAIEFYSITLRERRYTGYKGGIAFD